MPSVTAAVLASGALTGSLADLATVPAGETWRIDAVAVANETGAVVALTMALNPRTAGTDRTVVPNRNVGDDKTDQAPEMVGQYLEAGGKIRGHLIQLPDSRFIENIGPGVWLIEAELRPAFAPVNQLKIGIGRHGLMLLFQQQSRPLARHQCIGRRCQTVYCYA